MTVSFSLLLNEIGNTRLISSNLKTAVFLEFFQFYFKRAPLSVMLFSMKRYSLTLKECKENISKLSYYICIVSVLKEPKGQQTPSLGYSRGQY